MKQTPVLVINPTQSTYLEIDVTCPSPGHNDLMPNTGIETAMLQSLALRSNQLRFAAACPRVARNQTPADLMVRATDRPSHRTNLFAR